MIGLSDHSIGNYTCFAAVALGARILEKHFTSDKTWPGPDVPISMDPAELEDLVARFARRLRGARRRQNDPSGRATHHRLRLCVRRDDPRRSTEGETFSAANVWVKRPGTGEIKARDFDRVLGRPRARDTIPANVQLSWRDVE